MNRPSHISGATERPVLFLTPFVPRRDAPHGGRVTGQLIERLALRRPVGIVCIRDADEPGIDPRVAASCATVVEVARRAPDPTENPWRERVRRLSRLARGVPGMVAWANVTGYADAVRTVVTELRPAIVQLETHAMAQHLPALSGSDARTVLVDHDPGANAARDAARAGTAVDALSQRLEALAWRRFARRTLAHVDAVVTFTERDRRATEAGRPGLRVVRIPFGTDLPERPLDPVGGEPATLLLFGGYQHPPNADAARRVMGPIFDCVAARRPDAVLDVVGSRPTPEMQRLVRDGVRLHGRVPSVEPYLDRAAVVVVPLRLGGGMRVKVLETLAAGKPLVASARGVDGLDLASGRQFVLAESDAEFCEAVVALLDDPERRQELGAAARSWAEANLGWDAVVAAYEQLYASLPAPRSGGA